MRTKQDLQTPILIATLPWLIMLSGCDEASSTDAGVDSGTDGAVTPDAGARCARPADCEDGVFCTEHVCMPGAASADARGCVLVDGPCSASETCDEAIDTCMANDCTVPDADGDGDPSIACGGSDCDDDDGNRFPGNPEVCDAEGHDEDCVPNSVAGDDGDQDGDGFTSALCCNGATCGDDCDDEDPAVRPGARETCDGRDVDCDGAVDEEADGPICPGGVCRAGRCDLPAWARTFGGEGSDRPAGVAMDEFGNVYVAGHFTGTSHFGRAAGPTTSTDDGTGSPSTDLFVASYGADGRFRWVTSLGGAGDDQGELFAYDEAAELLYLVATTQSSITVAGTSLSGRFVLAFDLSGEAQWSTPLPWAVFPAEVNALAGANGPVLAGNFVSGPIDFGAGERGTSGRHGYVLKLSASGTHDWDHVTGDAGAGAEFEYTSVVVSSTGHIVLSGVYRNGPGVDFGGGLRGPFDIYSAGFVLSLSPEGGYEWDYIVASTSGGSVFSTVLEGQLSTDLFVAGSHGGVVDFGDGPTTPDSGQTLVRLDSTGTFVDRVSWANLSSLNSLDAIGSDSSENVLLAGRFVSAVNFGGGETPAPSLGATFVAGFDAELNHRWDDVLTHPGFPGADCALASCSSAPTGLQVGPADSTVLVGTFRGDIDLGVVTRRETGATGSGDIYLLRLSN